MRGRDIGHPASFWAGIHFYRRGSSPRFNSGGVPTPRATTRHRQAHPPPSPNHLDTVVKGVAAEDIARSECRTGSPRSNDAGQGQFFRLMA
jgi:hypothetical protein